MNKYSIRAHLSTTLQGCESTFKDTSYDDANQTHLCSDSQTPNVYDFDQYVLQNKQGAIIPSSPDAIYLGSKQFYFVEFKNQKPADINNPQLQKKFTQGTKILQDMLHDFTADDIEFTFCVVYKPQATRYFGGASFIQANAVRFGLDEVNESLGRFYDQIITQDIDFYKTNFPQLQCQ